MKHLVVRSAWILGMTLAAFSGCDNTREQTETRQGAATTGLQPGDVAITCFDSLDTSGTAGTSGGLGKQMIQIFTLVPLPGARDIRWTDREATTDGTFNTGEIVDGTAMLATIPELVAVKILAARPHLKTKPLPPTMKIEGSHAELLWPAVTDDDEPCKFVRAKIREIAMTVQGTKRPPVR